MINQKPYPRCLGTKFCNKCEKDKNVLAFSVKRNTADGLNNHCRDCVAEYNKEYRVTHKGKGKVSPSRFKNSEIYYD